MAAKKKPARPSTPATRRRSQEWFGREGKMGFIYRSWVKNRGLPHDQFDGRPVIGICNTYSELTPCNSHFRTLAEHVKAGVWEAGGFPLEFPVMSLGETLLRPTAMLYRNLASHGRRGVASAAIRSTAWCCSWAATRPRRRCSWARRAWTCRRSASRAARCSRAGTSGERIGSGTNTWSLSEDLRAGKITRGRVPRGRELHAPLARPLHGRWARPRPWPRWSRRSAWACRATPPFPRSTRAAT